MPNSILYDNTKMAVARILGDGTRQRTRVFSELQSHYLFADRFGRPGKGNDKGKVGGSGRLDPTELPGADAASGELRGAEREAARRLPPAGSAIGCAVTPRRSANGWRATWRSSSSLPATPYDACEKKTGRVSSLSLVRYRGTDYSVPTAYGHREVLIRGYVHEVVISCGADIIARHARSYEREDFVFYGDHTFRSLDSIGERIGPNEVSRSVNGAEAGIQGGYNWQSRCTLFGIEADYQWTNIDHDFTRTGPLGLATLSGSVSLQSFGTIRARTGVIVDNVLLYLTGGFAYANTEPTVAFTVAGAPQLNLGPFTDEKTRWGWTMGFGTEWQFAPNWSWKSEVLYARFETDESTRACGVALCGVPTNLRFEHDSSAWVTRIGINYYFGNFGKGPVRAAY